jgi:hypothetical protein
MTSIPRTIFVSILFVACTTDPGDVGSGSATLSGSAEAGDSADDGAEAPGDDDDDGASSDGDGGTQTEAGSSDDGVTSEPGTSDDGPDPGSEGSDGAGSSSAGGTSGGGGESGTMVADCSECGPDEGCVAEVAFATEYFCVPIPDACGLEFDCACASEYCVDPFTICTDFPDPPQRAIACECPNC